MGSIIYGHASQFYNFNCAKIVTIFIKNTTFFKNELSQSAYVASLISIGCSRLLLMGVVRFHRNNIDLSTLHGRLLEGSLIEVHKITCTAITLYGYVEISQNTASSLIHYVKCATQECFTMNVAGNATLFITKNTIGTYFRSEWDDHLSAEKFNYPPCFFQYLKSNTIDANYLIIFNKNVIYIWFPFLSLLLM